MSKILKDRVIILRTYEFGESSIVAVVLARRHGKVRLLAKGARRSGSRLSGILRTGNLGEAVFYFREQRGMQLLKEISAGPVFGPGTEDLERLCTFQAGLEIVDRSVVGREAGSRTFDVFEGFMRLVTGGVDPWLAFFAFEVRLLKVLGLYPDLGECSVCGKQLSGTGIGFDPPDGVVRCAACGRNDAKLALSAGSHELLGRIEAGGYGALQKETLLPAQRREIGGLLHRIFLYHIDGYRFPRALSLLKGVNRD